MKNLSPQVVYKTTVEVLNEKIANIKRGFRKGQIESRKEVSAVQDAIVNLLDEANLTKEDRA